jgi:predicted DCC family thiol-disulfide oxidoreductase YuxK
VRQLRLLDRAGRLEFIALQAAAELPDRPELPAIAESRPLADDLHVVLPDGRVESGGRAYLEIMYVLPGGVLFRPWPHIPGILALVDASYRWVAGHRALLARLLRLD